MPARAHHLNPETKVWRIIQRAREFRSLTGELRPLVQTAMDLGHMAVEHGNVDGLQLHAAALVVSQHMHYSHRRDVGHYKFFASIDLAAIRDGTPPPRLPVFAADYRDLFNGLQYWIERWRADVGWRPDAAPDGSPPPKFDYRRQLRYLEAAKDNPAVTTARGVWEEVRDQSESALRKWLAAQRAGERGADQPIGLWSEDGTSAGSVRVDAFRSAEFLLSYVALQPNPNAPPAPQPSNA